MAQLYVSKETIAHTFTNPSQKKMYKSCRWLFHLSVQNIRNDKKVATMAIDTLSMHLAQHEIYSKNKKITLRYDEIPEKDVMNIIVNIVMRLKTINHHLII